MLPQYMSRHMGRYDTFIAYRAAKYTTTLAIWETRQDRIICILWATKPKPTTTGIPNFREY